MTGKFGITPRAHFIQVVGAVAYLACLEASKVERRTKRLGLKRETYDVEYAFAAQQAVKAYLYANLPASAIETGTAKTEGLGPQDESAAPKVDAQPLVKGETNHG